ncbi:MAG: amidase [Rubrivivax sp.]|nr:amidase [Rubrivivax sp.]
MAEVVLKAQDLRAGYGSVPVLHGISLEVMEDQIVGILGHNGMGKTTLIKALMGLVPITGGRLEINGADFTRAAPHLRARAGIGYVPQGRGILPALSVEENLRLAWLRNTDEAEDQALERVLALFPRVQRLLDRRGGLLSGGEQQLLALARALMTDPWLLLLDEPTEGIQPSIIEEMAATLVQLRSGHGLTLVVVEQNLDFILDCADRVLLLEKGVIESEIAGERLRDPTQLARFVGLGAARSTRGATPAARAPSAPVAPLSPHGAPAPAAPLPTPLAPTGPTMTVRRPTLEQMKTLVADLGMTMPDQEIQSFMQEMEGSMAAYDRVDSLPDYLPKVRYPRTPGYRPSAAENPLNAWYVKCEVRGNGSGPLEGRRIVLKDNVCLAGVPMMNGASTLEGYVPDLDATLVTRILDAGGTIVGKAHCEYFCLSAGSHTNATGPVHNPWRMGWMTGGSSSGTAALVAAGEVPMGIGGDQGGSIRMPAALCGIVGMKPTHGLVPYTGVMPIEATIDHAGPMTATVADNALLLEVIAGADELDPRQYSPRVDKYTAALGRGVSGLRIGVVREGFGHPQSDPGVDAKVRGAAERLARLGAQVEDVSIPMHLDGPAIWTPVALEGLQAQMMNGNGMGFNWKGLYTTSLLDRHANWRSRANELSPSLKVSMLIGQYFIKHYGGRFYAKAQNLARLLRHTYDEVLGRYDILLMPTTPLAAQPIPPAGSPLSLVLQRAFEMIPNTAPFDVTGHPSISVPCGLVDGLPVGLMLTGKHWSESTLYRAGHALEQSGDWRNF